MAQRKGQEPRRRRRLVLHAGELDLVGAAARYNYAPSTIYHFTSKLPAADRLPHSKRQGHLVFAIADTDRWMELRGWRAPDEGGRDVVTGGRETRA